MGLFVSLILVAVGAILAWAVHPASSGSVDVGTVGYILLVVGLVGLLLDLLVLESWGPQLHRRRAVYEGPADRTYAEPAGRRRTVIEEDDAL